MIFMFVPSKQYWREDKQRWEWTYPELEGHFESGERPREGVVGNTVRVPLLTGCEEEQEIARRQLLDCVAWARRDADNCPSCGTSLLDKPIPEADREAYGGSTHFRRVIGVYSRELDVTVAWRCPDCGYEEKRFI